MEVPSMFFWRRPKFNITTLNPGTPGPGDFAAAEPLAHYAIHPTQTPRRRVAFVVFHGMGQQVPYETQSMLAECMLEKESDESKGKYPDAKMVRVKLTPNDPPIGRIEFAVERRSDDQAPPKQLMFISTKPIGLP